VVDLLDRGGGGDRVGVLAASRRRMDARRAAARSLAAEEALRERFARGEIDEEELVQRMAALRASRDR